MRTLPDGMREKVLVAAELFADFGLDATKMEDVAATTGVPKATLYYYFEGKEDILAFLFVEILDEVGRRGDGRARRAAGRPPSASAGDRAHLRRVRDLPRRQPGAAVRPRAGPPGSR